MASILVEEVRVYYQQPPDMAELAAFLIVAQVIKFQGLVVSVEA